MGRASTYESLRQTGRVAVIGILKVKEGWVATAGAVLAIALGILGGEFHNDLVALEWKNHLATATVGGLMAGVAVFARRLV